METQKIDRRKREFRKHRVDCVCAICTQNKKIGETVEQIKNDFDKPIPQLEKTEITENEKSEIIRIYLENLPSNTVVYQLNDNLIILIKEKLKDLSKNAELSKLSYRNFITKLIDISLQFYLETLDNE